MDEIQRATRKQQTKPQKRVLLAKWLIVSEAMRDAYIKARTEPVQASFCPSNLKEFATAFSEITTVCSSSGMRPVTTGPRSDGSLSDIDYV